MPGYHKAEGEEAEATCRQQLAFSRLSHALLTSPWLPLLLMLQESCGMCRGACMPD
jgi:hypothetical protein